MGNVELSPNVKTLQLGRMKNQFPTNLNSMTLHKHRRMLYTLACSGICDIPSFQQSQTQERISLRWEITGEVFFKQSMTCLSAPEADT